MREKWARMQRYMSRHAGNVGSGYGGQMGQDTWERWAGVRMRGEMGQDPSTDGPGYVGKMGQNVRKFRSEYGRQWVRMLGIYGNGSGPSKRWVRMWGKLILDD
jgi:hypothetical protein